MFHRAAHPLVSAVNVVISGRGSNGSDWLFQASGWKRISTSGQSGAAFVLSPDKSPVPIESERVSRFLI
jgi:hypothetical protein